MAFQLADLTSAPVRISVNDLLFKVMVDLLQNELDSSDFELLQEYHPRLRGMTRERVQAFIDGARDASGKR